MKTRLSLPVSLLLGSLLLVGSLSGSLDHGLSVGVRQVEARPGRQGDRLRRDNRQTTQTSRRSTAPQDHGGRAYATALGFARQHKLPHFTVNKNGVKRVVVNVPSDKIGAWCNVFSQRKGYLEPFFQGSRTSKPSWSMLRMGDRSLMEFGTGDAYRPRTNSCRVAFPVSLSPQELTETGNKLKTRTNRPWAYAAGVGSSKQNCTNWVTEELGRFTGVSTGSVKHHMRALVNGRHSNRMTVMAVMTPAKVQNFGQEQLRMEW